MLQQAKPKPGRRFKCLTHHAAPRKRDPDLTGLINIVFLILIFFLVAGALRPFSARDLQLAKIAKDAAEAVTPGTLVIHRDGRIAYRGHWLNPEQLAAAIDASAPVRQITIVADGRLDGHTLLEVVATLRGAGVPAISVMVERGLE